MTSDDTEFDGRESQTRRDRQSASAAVSSSDHRGRTPETVAFQSRGVRCEADLYVPTAGEPPWPTVVMAHGFGGERTWGLAPFAERFAAAGFAAFVFDYRHLGGSGGTPRRLIDPDRQLADWAAALAHAGSLSVVDADRIALWGTSFGAGHALATAARAPGVAAVVAQVPFVDGPATIAHQARGRRRRSRARLALLAVLDRAASVIGRGPIEVPLATDPGMGGLLDTPGALTGVESVVPGDDALVNRTPARVVLDLRSYRPGRLVEDIEAPVHVVVAEDDRLLPVATERTLDRLPDASVHRVPAGHFDVHHAPWLDPVTDAQIAFLSSALNAE